MKSKFYSHRGIFDNKNIYENTLEAFDASIKRGYGIELDVRLTKDYEVVVFHDSNLKRMFNDDRKVIDFTWQELTNLQLVGPSISKFEEVLEFIDGQVPIIVELKPCSPYKVLAEKTRDLLLNYKGKYTVESFHPLIVRWFRKNEPKFERGQLLMSVGQYDCKLAGIIMISHLTHFITFPDFYAYRKELGQSRFSKWFLNRISKKIVVWTIKPGDVINLKVDEVIFEGIDNPEKRYII